MDSEKKRVQLATIIRNKLGALIDADYVLYGLPNYRNEGDVLIWQGTLDFLETIPHKCLDYCFYDQYGFKDIPEDVIILIIGGGYFGDIWRKAWENVVNFVKNYPDNKIIFLPQSIWYESEDCLNDDRETLSV